MCIEINYKGINKMRIVNTDGNKAQRKLDKDAKRLAERTTEQKLKDLMLEYERASNRFERAKKDVLAWQSHVDAIKNEMFQLIKG